jgi:site-specific DNA recombinase
MNANPRAVIYCRVSTAEQAENGTSLETQELVCLRKATEMNAQLIAIHRDEGVSGAYYITRPAIQAALADVESGRADTLIIAKLDRSGRDVDIIRDIQRRVERAGGRVVSCDGMNFGNSAAGKLALNTLAGFAEFEKEVIRERTMSGSRRRAEEGKQPNRTFSPYGYRILGNADVAAGRCTSEQMGTYEVIPEQARIVRELFERYAAGQSLYSLCCWLEEQGIPTSKGGARWHKSTVKVLLNNPVYKGTAVFGRWQAFRDERRVQDGMRPEYRRLAPSDRQISIPAPAIVSEELWDTCQRRLHDNKELSGGNPTRKYMLGGLMHCPTCNRKLRGKMAAGTKYYVCPSSQGRHPCSEPRKHYRADEFEEMVARALIETATHPEWIESAVRAYDAEAASHPSAVDVEELTRELQELEAEQKAAVKAQIAGIRQGMSAEFYAEVFEELGARRQRLEARLREAATQSEKGEGPKSVAEKVAAVIRSVEEVLTSAELTPAEKQSVLSTVVERMLPTDEGLSIFVRNQTVHTVCLVCTVKGAIRVEVVARPQ